MESTKCCICGKEISMDMTCIVMFKGLSFIKTCCCSHEGSKEFKEYLVKNKIPNDKHE